MARPSKTGLEYFSMDVDIFEDEKVIPTSSEFGAEGECVFVRVLCAIYRNGYFVECTDGFMFKIAKQSNVSYSTVSSVIEGLVKWGFFDASLYANSNILTSNGIQLRWKEATRKRVLQKNLEFWLNPQKAGFLPPETTQKETETTVIQAETPQSKVKESKVNDIKETEETPTPKKRVKIQPDALQFPFSSPSFFKAWTDLLLLAKWKKKPMSALQMSLTQLSKYEEAFAIKLIENATAGNYQGVVYPDTDEVYLKWQKSFKPAVNSKTQINSPVKNYPGWD